MFGFADVLTMLIGVSMFLFGMNIMGDGLEKSAGNKLKGVLAMLTSSKIKGLLLGLVVTAVIQSSGATTVMVVGFVNSGLMTLTQGIPVIMGANIGTTVTAWILSLSGIDGGVWYVAMFKPDNFVPFVAIIGIILYMFTKGPKKKDIGQIMLGFAVLMFGMSTMSGALEKLGEVPAFREALALFSDNMFLGVLAGAVVTTLMQSSSASVGVLQAIAGSGGGLTIGATIPIIMGQNIGSTTTAMLSSVGTNKNAKRVAAVHFYFNLIGTIIGLIAFAIFKYAVNIPILNQNANEFTIAICHSMFNIIFTFLFLPFVNLLQKLAEKTVGNSKNQNDDTIMLDERLIATPSIALGSCRDLVSQMSKLSVKSLNMSFELFSEYDEKKFEEIKQLEGKVDEYEDAVGTYLVKLSSASNLTPENSREITKLLHMIGDLERLSDHAVNIAKSLYEMDEKKIKFSDTARKELSVMIEAVSEILDLSNNCFVNNDLKTAYLVEPLEQVIDRLKSKIKKGHIIRLQNEECTIELGFVLSDLITNLERVSDHCSNIAGTVIELANNELSLHEYYHEIKEIGDFRTEYFNKKYEMYKEKYALPTQE